MNNWDVISTRDATLDYIYVSDDLWYAIVARYCEKAGIPFIPRLLA